MLTMDGSAFVSYIPKSALNSLNKYMVGLKNQTRKIMHWI